MSPNDVARQKVSYIKSEISKEHQGGVPEGRYKYEPKIQGEVRDGNTSLEIISI